MEKAMEILRGFRTKVNNKIVSAKNSMAINQKCGE
jgi:hypothetical protein